MNNNTMHQNEIEYHENRLKMLETQATRWLTAYECAKEDADAVRKLLEEAQ